MDNHFEDQRRTLVAGTKFLSRNGLRTGVVGEMLGEGGQGAVYSADLDGARFALKWYHEYYLTADRGLYERLAKAVERGAPDASFLWPLELVKILDRPSFGYIMPLREPTFVCMRDLIAPPPRRVELSLEKRITLCSRIAQSFLELHASGFCYQDINFGNIFFNAERAEVLICDNDNVNIDGAEASIYGTRKFMAPEVVRREVLPCTKTDLFSMAVLFFYIIFGWHPLDGRKEATIRILDNKAENALYGTEPVFIFDPVNTSNGPISPLHDALVYRWQSLSEDLRKLFIRSFTVGLFSPDQRVLEREWQNAFSAASHAVFYCQECGYEHVASADTAKNAPIKCVRCGDVLDIPQLIVIGHNVFAVRPGQAIPMRVAYPDENSPAHAVAGVVEPHPEKAGVSGLRNTTEAIWKAGLPGQRLFSVGPQKTIRITEGMQIEFGLTRAVVAGADPAPDESATGS